MEELVIQTHDFEESKNQLKKFSEETTTDLDLKRVDTGKDVGEFFGDLFLGRGIGTDHIVKGSELNSLMEDIQQHLIDINNMQRSFIGEIGHVYSALESLDRDYIQAILSAVKSAQKANGEAKIAQADIGKTIEEQKKIIKVLQQFKEKLDKFEHLIDVDKMWSDTQIQEKEIIVVKDEMSKINTTLEEQAETIVKLQLMKEIIDAVEHISDIDKLWEDVQTVNETIRSLDKGVEQLIAKLVKQADQLSSNQTVITKITDQKFIYDVDETKLVVDGLVQKTEKVTNDTSFMGKTIDDILSKIDKVESISHLADVDLIYDEMQNLKETIDSL